MVKLALLGRRHSARYEAAALQLRGVEVAARVDAAGAGRFLRESPAVDAVVFAGDDHDFQSGAGESTVRLATQAAACGKHVLIESPVATSEVEVERIAAACAGAAVHLAVGRLCRFRPSVAAAGAALSSGKLGEPGLVRIHAWQPRQGGDTGGTCADGALRVSRELDLARWFFRRAPTEVYATTGPRTAAEYLQVHCGFEGGGMAVVDCAATLPRGATGYYSLSVIGAAGAAYADDHHNTHLLFANGDPRALISAQDAAAVRNQLRAFVTLIERAPHGAHAEGEGSGLGDSAGERELLQIAGAVRKSLSHHQSLRRDDGGYTIV